MTHKELVRAAVRWLTNTEHCGAVLAEISAAAIERPDAIGWQAHKSIVVECKASRSDFLADKNKSSARIGRLVGNERYYLSEAMILRPEDVAGTPYGLITVDGSQCRVRVKAQHRALSDVELMDERTMLVAALRRIQTREFLTIVPLGLDEVLRT